MNNEKVPLNTKKCAKLFFGEQKMFFILYAHAWPNIDETHSVSRQHLGILIPLFECPSNSMIKEKISKHKV